MYSTLSCDMEKRHGIVPKIFFPTDKLQQAGLKLHSVKDNLLRMNMCTMLSAILMPLPDLMTGLRKWLYRITICRGTRELVPSKQSCLAIPPGWDFSSAPGHLLIAASLFPHGLTIRKQGKIAFRRVQEI